MENQFMSLLEPEGRQSGFPKKEDCIYTPHFCEENIWMLLKKIQENAPEQLHCYFPVFISNDINVIPLWRQIVSKQEDGYVAWDYHVIMIYCDGEKSVVFDFDTQLPFPTPFNRYCEETFKTDEILHPQFHRFFRIVSAELFLKYFSSDRRHMKNKDGSWIKSPPNYPCINNGEETHNLPQYISMKEDNIKRSRYGDVFNLKSFVTRFSNKNSSQINYMYPPEPLQPSWLE